MKPAWKVPSSYCVELGYSPAPAVFRQCPPGHPTVKDIVRPGMTIKTSYNTGGVVRCVSGPHHAEGYGDTYSIAYGIGGAHSDGYLNDLVTDEEGRIIGSCDTEVFVVDMQLRQPGRDPVRFEGDKMVTVHVVEEPPTTGGARKFHAAHEDARQGGLDL
jgi:hypothetical protein